MIQILCRIPFCSSVVRLQNSLYSGFSKFPLTSSTREPTPNLENDKSMEPLCRLLYSKKKYWALVKDRYEWYLNTPCLIASIRMINYITSNLDVGLQIPVHLMLKASLEHSHRVEMPHYRTLSFLLLLWLANKLLRRPTG